MKTRDHSDNPLLSRRTLLKNSCRPRILLPLQSRDPDATTGILHAIRPALSSGLQVRTEYLRFTTAPRIT